VESGAKAIIVNRQPTAFDAYAQLVIDGDVTEVLPRIVQAVQQIVELA
jgi:NAD-dependent SIR2 family protein deacetylase